MASPQMVMYEEEFAQVQAVTNRLVQDANARVVFVIDKNGQLISASGDTGDLDTTSLASLTAGTIAATGGIAQLLGSRSSRPSTTRGSGRTFTFKWSAVP